MSVDNKRRRQFKQPNKHSRGNKDPANAVSKSAGYKNDLGMVRADPHDPYDKEKGGGKKFIDGWGHKDFDKP